MLIGLFCFALQAAAMDAPMTAAVFEAWLTGFSYDKQYEQVRTSETGLQYEYSFEDTNEVDFYFSYTLEEQKSKREARKYSRAYLDIVSETLNTKGEQVRMVKRGEVALGDKGEIYRIENDGQVVGSLVVCRKGTWTISLVVIGVYFDDADVADFMTPLMANR